MTSERGESNSEVLSILKRKSKHEAHYQIPPEERLEIAHDYEEIGIWPTQQKWELGESNVYKILYEVTAAELYMTGETSTNLNKTVEDELNIIKRQEARYKKLREVTSRQEVVQNFERMPILKHLVRIFIKEGDISTYLSKEFKIKNLPESLDRHFYKFLISGIDKEGVWRWIRKFMYAQFMLPGSRKLNQNGINVNLLLAGIYDLNLPNDQGRDLKNFLKYLALIDADIFPGHVNIQDLSGYYRNIAVGQPLSFYLFVSRYPKEGSREKLIEEIRRTLNYKSKSPAQKAYDAGVRTADCILLAQSSDDINIINLTKSPLIQIFEGYQQVVKGSQ